jgi:hypothetical protein
MTNSELQAIALRLAAATTPGLRDLMTRSPSLQLARQSAVASIGGPTAQLMATLGAKKRPWDMSSTAAALAAASCGLTDLAAQIGQRDAAFEATRKVRVFDSLNVDHLRVLR